MEIRRTWLEQPVREVMQDLWPYLEEGTGQRFEDYRPRFDDQSRWYISLTEGQVSGAYWARQVNNITWEVHTNVRPQYWGGKLGTEYSQAALDHIFKDTDAGKIVALIPKCFPQVIATAEAIGMQREGVRTQSYLRDDKLYDQVHFGITRK